MPYKCSHCDYAAEQPGNCPTCDAPLAAEEEGSEDNANDMVEKGNEEETE
ncbi:MAG: C2H2-type zinc finger protein [Patescibacteria group bacterium]